MRVTNPKYDATKSLVKGAKGAAATGVSGAVVTLVMVGAGLLQGGELDAAGSDALAGSLLTLSAAGISGAVEWFRNRLKHRKAKKLNRVPRATGFAILVALGLALGGTLAGCTTTRLASDGSGTVIQEWDVDTAIKLYLFAVNEYERIQAQREYDNAAEAAQAQRERQRLEALLNLWGTRLLEAGQRYVEDADGVTIDVRTGKKVTQ